MSSPLREALRARLTQARRERDRDAAAALRTAVAAVENAEAVPQLLGSPVEVERLVLSDAEERRLVQAEIDDLRSAERDHRGRADEERAMAAGRAAAVVEQVLEAASPGQAG